MPGRTIESEQGLGSPLDTLVERYQPLDIDLRSTRARVRLLTSDGDDWDALLSSEGAELVPAAGRAEPDAELTADAATWATIAADVRGGMEAFRAGRLEIRRNLHLGVGFLAATAGSEDPERLRFRRIRTPNHRLSILEAGAGDPLLCVHGLGGTKASFLPTVSALAPEGHRVIAADLPGFGDSHKPRRAAYDAPWFAAAMIELLDELGIERVDLAGNSMGGRIAIELAMDQPERVRRVVLLSPALAWLRQRQWKWLLRMPLPRLGYIQPSPRWAVEPIVRRLVPGAEDGWTAAGIDDFLRAYLTPSGRFAFYESARNVYMDEPYGVEGFWTRLKKLPQEALFVWGREDTLVPISFMRHVERALPRAEHLELDCGHVPQLERPGETHRAMREFLER